MPNVVIRDQNAGADAAPFEIYTPQREGGTKLGGPYTVTELRNGITFDVSDTTTQAEIVSLGVRCSNNQVINWTFPVQLVPNFNINDADYAPDVFIEGPHEAEIDTTITLTAQVTNWGGEGSLSYSWTPGGETTKAINVTSNSAGDINYGVTVTNENSQTDNDDHNVEWLEEGEQPSGIKTGPIFQNQNDSSLIPISTTSINGVLTGRFGITWGSAAEESGYTGEQITATVESLPIAADFTVNINEVISKDRNQYTFTVTGEPAPGAYNLSIQFTVSNKYGDDTEVINPNVTIADTGNRIEQCTNPYTKYLTLARSRHEDFCDGNIYKASTPVQSAQYNLSLDLNQVLCTPMGGFKGGGLFYLISHTNRDIDPVNDQHQTIVKISTAGQVQSIGFINCNTYQSGGNISSTGNVLKSKGDVQEF